MSQVKHWRSYNELEQNQDFKNFSEREFQKDASVLEDAVSRRDFLKVMGAATVMAGVAGCNVNVRRPERKIYPYAKQPEYVVPGKAVYYATTYVSGKEVVGVLVESHEGRPTKVEGNPDHPESLGGVSRFQQASVLNLYDPDRLKSVMNKGQVVALADFDAWLNKKLGEAKGVKGKGLAILVSEQVSPTFYRVLSRITALYPEIQVYKHEPVNQDLESEALRVLTGKMLYKEVDYTKADVIVSLDSDFLGAGLSQVKHAKQFSTRRNPDGRMNRLYVFEPHYTMTGTKADHRYKVKSSEVKDVLVNLAKSLKKQGLVFTPDVARLLDTYHPKQIVETHVIDSIAKDLLHQAAGAALVAGDRQDAAIHGLVYAINEALKTNVIVYYEQPFSGETLVRQNSADSLNTLIKKAKEGQVQTLFICDADPLFTSSADVVSLFEKIDETVVLSTHLTKTAQKATWVVPQSHALESWGDAVSQSGTYSLVQPLIKPLYDSLSVIELMAKIAGSASSGYALVRQTFKQSVVGDTETQWSVALNTGKVKNYNSEVRALTLKAGAVPGLFNTIQTVSEGIEVSFAPSYALFDGRFANNSWMQECPDPITKLTWDNAALMSKMTAEKLRLKSEDRVKLVSSGKEVDSVVFTVPGHVDDAISLFVGYGNVIGRVSEGAGFDVYALTSPEKGLSTIAPVTLIKQKGSYKLASTQDHGSMEGRPLYREATLEAYKKSPDFAQHMVEHPPLKSLWPEKAYDSGYQWGMVIDLNKCTGCNACLIGCQSENNIPAVGKSQVLNGREMHWIRVDRYFEGEESNPKVYEQPVTCLQCENAPCEQVCPVAATTHSEEGLNDMTYNRCVGTRYCSDNCPAKVRRFNFFDYHQRNPQSVAKNRKHLFDYMREPDRQIQKQFNPDVTVRMRGMMEKCTYCVQRINQGKIASKNENRTLRDGEVVTACQQACPSDAIVFGDILNKKSKVYKLKNSNRNYTILEQLHLKARTSYLASVRNPNPELLTHTKELKAEGVHHS